MRTFLIFTQKEFFHIFRDRWTTIILLVLPILMIVLFGFGIVTEIKNARFAVYDLSRDQASTGIVDKLNTSEFFTYYGQVYSEKEIEILLKEDKIGMAIVFSEEFHQHLVRSGEAQLMLITDGTDPNTANTLTNYAQRLINEYLLGLKEIQLSQVPYSIVPEVKLLYNPTLKGVYNTAPGVMGMILILICVMMTSISIAREKEKGTMEVLLVSPLSPLTIIISKVVPYMAISLINITNILVISYFLLDIPIAGSLGLIYFVSVIYIFVSLALGLLISSVAETQLVALLGSVLTLLLPVILLSGLMFPIESMPRPLQWLAQIIPAKWYIEALRTIMIKGLGIMAIYKQLVVLTGMGVLLTMLSLKKFKIRLE